jgi:aminopeptidase
MTDPRVLKLAKVLVHYSIELKRGDTLELFSSHLAKELTLAVYEEAIKAGAHVTLTQYSEEMQELFLKYASDEQIDTISPISRMLVEDFDTFLGLIAPENRRHLAGIQPERIARWRKSRAELFKISLERAARKEHRWCVTTYPNNANAQDADMSLADYTEFVYAAGMLNEDDPVAFWKNEAKKQERLIDWLKGRDRVALKGPDVDMTFSIKDRVFLSAAGKLNFPDGEIYTAPIEESANGWIRYKYPAITAGQEVQDIELWFEDGKIVKEKAGKNQELLTAMLNTDKGARYLGEWGIGTNYGIQRFTKDMLFDEKIGGTIHFAAGASYPESGGKNESAIHWDMLCDMNAAEITVDGELFYRNGKPVV